MSNNFLIPQVGVQRVDSQEQKIKSPSIKTNKEEFNKLLDQEFEKHEVKDTNIKFSNHALERIKDRGISMNSMEMKNLQNAIDTAASKGSKETLVLTNEAAFIVSVPNRTVITALDRSNLLGNVFTNIDSTVVI